MIFKGSLKRTGLTALLLASTALVAPAHAASTNASLVAATATQQNAVANAATGNLYDYAGGGYYAPGTNNATGLGATAITVQLHYGTALNVTAATAAVAATSKTPAVPATPASFTGATMTGAYTVLGGTPGTIGTLPTFSTSPVGSAFISAPTTAAVPNTTDTANQTATITINASAAGVSFGCFNGYVGIITPNDDASVTPASSVQQMVLQLNAGLGPLAKGTTAAPSAAVKSNTGTPVACGDARPMQLATYNSTGLAYPDSIVILPNHALTQAVIGAATAAADFTVVADNGVAIGAKTGTDLPNTAAPISVGAPTWTPLTSLVGLSNGVVGASVYNPGTFVGLIPFNTGFLGSTAWNGAAASASASPATVFPNGTATVGQFWVTKVAETSYQYADVFDTATATFGKLKNLVLSPSTGLSASLDGAAPIVTGVSREFTGSVQLQDQDGRTPTGVVVLTFSEPVSGANPASLNAAAQSLLTSVGLSAGAGMPISPNQGLSSMSALSGANNLTAAVLPATGLITATGTLGSDSLVNNALTILNGGWGVIGSMSQNLTNSAADRAIRNNPNAVVFDLLDQNGANTDGSSYLNGYSLTTLGVVPAYDPLVQSAVGSGTLINTAPITNLPYLAPYVDPTTQATLGEIWPVFNSQGQVSDLLVYPNGNILTKTGGNTLASDFTINIAYSDSQGNLQTLVFTPLADDPNTGTRILASGRAVDLPLPSPLAISSNVNSVMVTYTPGSTRLLGTLTATTTVNGVAVPVTTPVAGVTLTGNNTNFNHSGSDYNGLFTQQISGQVQKRLSSLDVANGYAPANIGKVVGIPGALVRADLAYFDKGRTLTGAAQITVPLLVNAVKTTLNNTVLDISNICNSYNQNSSSSYNSTYTQSALPNTSCGALLQTLDAEATAGVTSIPAFVTVGTNEDSGNTLVALSNGATDVSTIESATVYPVTISTGATNGAFNITGANGSNIAGTITVQNTQPYLNVINTAYGSTDTNGNYFVTVGTSATPPAPAFVLISVLPGGSTNGEENHWELATYADQSLANYLPFTPDISTGATGSTPSTTLPGGGTTTIAGKTVQNIRWDLIGSTTLSYNPNGNYNGTNNYNQYPTGWQLLGLPGNIARSAKPANFQMQTLLTTLGNSGPISLWAGTSFNRNNSSQANVTGLGAEAFVLSASTAAADFSVDGGLTNVANIKGSWASGLGLAINFNQGPNTDQAFVARGLSDDSVTIYYPLSENPSYVAGSTAAATASPTVTGTSATATAAPASLTPPTVALPVTLPVGWSLVTYQGNLPGDPATFGTGTSVYNANYGVTYTAGNFGKPEKVTTALTAIIQASDWNQAQVWLASNTVADYTNGDQTGSTNNTLANTLTTLQPGQAYFVYAPAQIKGFTFE